MMGVPKTHEQKESTFTYNFISHMGEHRYAQKERSKGTGKQHLSQLIYTNSHEKNIYIPDQFTVFRTPEQSERGSIDANNLSH